MIINYLGANCIKVQVGDRVTIFDPIGKAGDLKPTRFGADIAFRSCRVPVVGLEGVMSDTKNTFVIDGPGEYEIGGSFIHGFSSTGPDGRLNTIYTFTDDGLRLCHLGFLADGTLSADVQEAATGVDVLFVPIGGWGTLAPKAAAALATLLEPRLVIPISWGPTDAAGPATLLADFQKQFGGSSEAVDKLTIKKKDVEGKEGELVTIASFDDSL